MRMDCLSLFNIGHVVFLFIIVDQRRHPSSHSTAKTTNDAYILNGLATEIPFGEIMEAFVVVRSTNVAGFGYVKLFNHGDRRLFPNGDQEMHWRMALRH